jgi:single-strand DNA-binding protein
MNRTEHMGGLTKEPVLRVLPSGIPVCEFSLAIARVKWNAEIDTLFLAVQAWASLAEHVAGMGLVRGDTVHVVGELSQQEYEKRDGSKDRKTRIEAVIVTPVKQRDAARRPEMTAPWDEEPPPDGLDPPF